MAVLSSSRHGSTEDLGKLSREKAELESKMRKKELQIDELKDENRKMEKQK